MRPLFPWTAISLAVHGFSDETAFINEIALFSEAVFEAEFVLYLSLYWYDSSNEQFI